MKKRFVYSIVALGIVFTIILSNMQGNVAFAAEIDSVSESEQEKEVDIFSVESEEMMKHYEVSETEIDIERPEDIPYNNMDRTIDENMLDEEVEYPDEEEEEDDLPNTDPNNAYIVTNNTTWNGTIEVANEFRWYAFNATTASKVTIFLQMDSILDADLYLFELDENTSSLELVDGCVTEGEGITEYLNTVVDAGIYFFAISGYESTGDFSFLYFQSSADVANEINDSVNSATTIGFGNVTGIIDNPLDYDYYKITLDSPAVIKYGITSSDGYTLGYAGSTGTDAGLYSIDSTNGFIKANAGTYYFCVMTNNNSVYSSTSTYTVNFKKIGNLSGVSTAYIYGISEAAGIVYEANSDASVNYVNGNLIDISYSYVANLSNSAGGQYYNITINPNLGETVAFVDGYEPAAVYYHSSTKPAKVVSSRPALMLTYYGDNAFYAIHCLGTGAYSMNTFNQNFQVVTVIIDPADGKLIDIVEFNYYYDFAPVGTNYITYTRSYSMVEYW